LKKFNFKNNKINKKKILIGGFIIISLIYWFLFFKITPTQFLDIGGDSAQYIILARNLIEGKGYIMSNLPGEPLCTHYPPGFPLLLSIVICFFKENILLLQFEVALLGFLSLFLTYKVLRRYVSSFFSFLCVLFLLFNRSFLHFSMQRVLSDVPFLFFSLLSIFMCEKYLDIKKTFDQNGFFLAAALIMSFLVRYTGLFLFLGIFIVFVLKKEYKKLKVISIPFFTVFSLWNFYTLFTPNPFASSHLKSFLLINPYIPSQGTLLDHPFQIVFRFIDGWDFYSLLVFKNIFPFLLVKLKSYISSFYFLPTIFMLLGIWIVFKKNKHCAFQYYFLIYFLFLSVANHRVTGGGMRYLVPILPFIFLFFFVALRSVFRYIFKKFNNFIYFVMISVLILNISVLRFRQPRYEILSPPWRNFIEIHKWINRNIKDKKSIIVSRKCTFTYFFTGHKSIIYPYTFDVKKIKEEIKKYKAKYIIVDSFSWQTKVYLLPFIYKYRKNLKLLYRIGNTGIFEVIKK